MLVNLYINNKNYFGITVNSYFSKLINEKVFQIEVLNDIESPLIIKHSIFIPQSQIVKSKFNQIEWSSCKSVEMINGLFRFQISIDNKPFYVYGDDNEHGFDLLFDTINQFKTE